jgi:hypothetical protein
VGNGEPKVNNGNVKGWDERQMSSHWAQRKVVPAAILGLAVVLATALLGGGNVLAAQTFRGTVVDDSSKVPLRDAIVTLLTNRGVEVGKPPVRTDSLGRFTLHAGEMGRYQLRVQRIGYQPLTSPVVNFSFGGHVHVLSLEMSAAPAKLGKVVVTASTRLTNTELMSYVGFDLRRSKGNGKFMDSTALDLYKTMPVAWVLEENRTLFGLEVIIGTNGFETLRMLRGATQCTPEIWIDGFEANTNSAVARLGSIGADQLYGVEIYTGLQLPAPSIGGEIGVTSANVSPARRCGSLAVWTKAFAQELKAKADAAARKPPPKQ